MDYAELLLVLPLVAGLENQTSAITGEADPEYEGPEPEGEGDHAGRHNIEAEAVNAIAGEMGANPSGSYSTIAERLAANDTAVATVAAAVTTEETRALAAEALKLAKASNLSDLASASTARTNLGLGSAAVKSTTDFDAAGLAAAEETRAKAAEALKLAIASNLSDLASASTARTNLGLGSAAVKSTTDFDAAGLAEAEETRAKAAEALKLAKASNLSDVASAQTSRENIGAGVPALDEQLLLVRPIVAPSLIIPSNQAFVENTAVFIRVMVPKTGKLHDLTFYCNVASGKQRAAIYDTGQATAEKYTRIWQSEAKEPAGGAWKIIDDPNLSVTAGQELMFGLISNNATASFGRAGVLNTVASASLPTGFLLATKTLPKLTGQRAMGEFAFAETITEANMLGNQNPPQMIARIS